MEIAIKAMISLVIILTCTYIGRGIPSLAGLIATMPLTALIVLCWLYVDNPGRRDIIAGYATGAAFGVLPSLLFFVSAMICFKRDLPFAITLVISFAIWSAGAIVHQLILR